MVASDTHVSLVKVLPKMRAEKFDFQSPAVHWMARTSSLNGLSCRIPYQNLDSLNALHPFSEEALFFTDFRFVASPSPNSVPTSRWPQPPIPPGTKPIHAGKKSWGINSCANTCGACIRTRANTGKYFRGGISRVFCQILRGVHSVRIHAAPVFAPARIQENIPGELFMYWFSARGVLPKSVVQMGEGLRALTFPQGSGVPKVLQYKLEVYGNTNCRCIAVEIGVVLQYFVEK